MEMLKDKIKLIEYVNSKNKRLIAPLGGNKDLGHDIIYDCIHFDEICSILKNKNYLKDEIINKYIKNFKKQKQGSNALVGSGFFGPFTCACIYMDINKSKAICNDNPEYAHEIINNMTDFMIDYAKLMEKLGSNLLWIAEPMAYLLSKEKFNEFSGNYLKKIFESTDVFGFLHICGDVTNIIDDMIKTKSQCISLDQNINLIDIINKVPKDLVIMGNTDPMFVLSSNYEEIYNNALKLNINLKNIDNYIFSTGCILPEQTPNSNIKALFDAGDYYNKKIKDAK
jgi:uroporphyrinogen decarboxylase